MISSVEAIHSKQINSQGDGTVTVSIVNPTGIMCQNPDRPAIVGDVYSVAPNGSIVARPAGTNGAWERAVIVGSAVVFAPSGASGIAVKFPYAADIPNV